MTHVIAQPCIDVKDKSCVDVCPVDCIHGGATTWLSQYFRKLPNLTTYYHFHLDSARLSKNAL